MAPFLTLSDILGYTSIGCWLGAQFPQVIENYKRRSVDGLAWPFLVNWLLGDASNLLGCILTNQLPFQTYLAIYFCFVDLSLVSQYIYYRSSVKPAPFPSRPRTTSIASLAGQRSLERPPTHYRALSNVAANVAAAAALAAQQEEHTRWHHNQHSTTARHFSPLDVETDEANDAEDDVDEDALVRLADSFHSDRGTHKKVTWSQSRERNGRGASLGRVHSRPMLSPITHYNPQASQSVSPILPNYEPEFASRGRPVSRPLDESQAEWTTESSAQRRNSRASRKGAGMVFLSVWALFSVGALVDSRRGKRETGIGRVLVRSADVLGELPPNAVVTAESLLDERPRADGDDVDSLSFDDLRFAGDTPPSDPPEDEGPSTEYIIGRISAWVCTTLYLTSRLPQIWKNYVRKSVDGLSIALFVFAFLGNFFYVASILTSPKLSLPEREASAFLRESVPYLLGSGGTLMFDVTIVTQSFLYRSKPHTHGRHLSRAIREEEEGLLAADATGAEDPSTPSRRRLPTGDEGAE
ncbi:PQ loop repeat-domain-containing protein [Irpex rosettiformis]|uniref:PQ loop repeat-domain-containing protein n=1 Tax=Irpex rosettiformis TaxID=378272 RepID=A0ACB8UHB1_9APHY|nr:PQ loop repeat-domain-containing protein [Irpex rosettiformis]